jgi:hypothetical protein
MHLSMGCIFVIINAMRNENPYIDITSYTEIYQELVYERNETIRWLDDHKLLERERFVDQSNKEEWTRQTIAISHRAFFRQKILDLFDRLYSHDAIEAIYDFNSVELNGWSDTEANRMERELQRLQVIIGKLERRYYLQYKILFEYKVDERTLYQNTIKVFSCGPNTLRHRLLTALFSDTKRVWTQNDIEKYFIDNFGYTLYQLTAKQIDKTAKDFLKDVAVATSVQDLLIVGGGVIRINPAFVT